MGTALLYLTTAIYWNFRSLATTALRFLAFPLLLRAILETCDQPYVSLGLALPVFALNLAYALKGWNRFRVELSALLICLALYFISCLETDAVLYGFPFVLALASTAATQQLGRLTTFLQAAAAGSFVLWSSFLSNETFAAPPYVVIWGLTASAYLAIGLWKRLLVLRQMGLTLMAGALVYLFFVEVWNYGAFTRVVAFLVLGASLVTLGFFYNKFAHLLRNIVTHDENEKV